MSTQQSSLDRMKQILERAPENRHSYFQLKHFVLGKEPTVQAKLWQCLRELEARRDTLEAIELELAESQDRLELIDIAMARERLNTSETSSFGINNPAESVLMEKEKAIRIRQLARQREALEKSMWKIQRKRTWTEQEARFFVQSFEALEKIEPLKDFDDLDAQKQYWNEKFTQQVNLKMLLQQSLDTELVQTVLALPEDCPIKKQTVTTIEHIQKQMIEMKEGYMKKITDAKVKLQKEKNE
jgi:hypothetical protein